MNMSSRANTQHNPIKARSIRAQSIRDVLEQRARVQNPGLANRLACRRKHHNTSYQGSSHRIQRWRDRGLLTLGAVLLALFVIRTETAVADEPAWGLQLKSDSGVYTELAIDTGIQIDITGLVARVEITQKFTKHGKWY